jgi:hemolysin III
MKDSGLKNRLLEPWSSLTHLTGALASLIGTALLVFLTWGDWPKAVPLAIYGASMVVLYATSTLFHGWKLPEERRMWLNRLDHVVIFLLIAGTYTPIVVTFFPEQWRPWVLGIIWLFAVLGMVYKLVARRIHGLINAGIYPVLSWAGVVPAALAYHSRPFLPPGGLGLLLIGGLVYMVGFVVYYFKWPDPWPQTFGHHELWHLFVMGGSLCHFLFMLLFVVPA